MNRAAMMVACATLTLLAGAAGQPKPEGSATPAAAKAEPAQTRGSVRFIQLPEVQPDLPPGAARDAVLVNCGVCHSARYITMQPPLTRETWLAEVTKMRKTFSAPVPEEQVNAIVDYLVAVRGAPSPAAPAAR